MSFWSRPHKTFVFLTTTLTTEDKAPTHSHSHTQAPLSEGCGVPLFRYGTTDSLETPPRTVAVSVAPAEEKSNSCSLVLVLVRSLAVVCLPRSLPPACYQFDLISPGSPRTICLRLAKGDCVLKDVPKLTTLVARLALFPAPALSGVAVSLGQTPVVWKLSACDSVVRLMSKLAYINLHAPFDEYCKSLPKNKLLISFKFLLYI